MSKFITAAKNNRAAALAESTGTGSRHAGPGRFEVKLVSAEIGENRAGTAKRAKLNYEVVAVVKGNPEDVGAQISEYISENHNTDSQSRRYTALVNQLLDAGIKEEKISDEDDETLWEAIMTAVQAANKFVNKGVEVLAALDHVESKKLAENGKPYFNNYFIERPASTAGTEKPKAEKPKAETPKAEKPKAETPKAEKPEAIDTDNLPF